MIARSQFRKSREGAAILTVLILTLIASFVMGSFLLYSGNNAHQTRMAADMLKAEVAAEAGLDYAIVKLSDVIRFYQLTPLISSNALQTLINDIPPPPAMGEYAYNTPDGSSAFRINIISPVISGVITNGTSAYGASGRYQLFEITCGAINTKTGMGAVLKQSVQALCAYLIRYGVFYDEDLEILPGPQMVFFGRVHCNADMYLGGPLEFYESVTAHGDVFHKRKDDGSAQGAAAIMDASTNMISMKHGNVYYDSEHPEWLTEAIDRWGGNMLSGAHGISRLDAPIDPTDDPHDLIERPLTTNDADYSEVTEREKFANKAVLTLHVSSNGVMNVTDFSGNNVSSYFTEAILVTNGFYDGKPEYAKDAGGFYQFSSNGSYDVSQTNFWDRRENANMAPVDIYVDQFMSQFPNMHDGVYPVSEGRGVIYVTRDDPDGPGGLMPAVRLRNGTEIPATLGLSFVSDLPVYIEGNYNITNSRPALVAGDAVTMLSVAWQDARSETLNLAHRQPENTEYRTVIMTGNTETTPGAYNGGLENVLRFQEKWNGREVKYRGSIIDLWQSEVATAPWSYGSYYTAPQRDWGYDLIYLNQTPPGMTAVFGMEEIHWTRTTWRDEGW